MDKHVSFSYTYSAVKNKEVQEIRKKYLPQGENKLEELKRLDCQVKVSGMAESLGLGILSSLVFGLGFCLLMHIVGEGALSASFGIALVIIGTVGMFFAYPVYRRVFLKTKKRFTPRILQLTDELTGGKIEF